MELLLTKAPQGGLIPHSHEDAEKIRKYGAGAVLRAEVREMRNPAFFRKWWALVKFAYDIWSETMPKQQYRGIEVEPTLDEFRKNVTILAGFFTPTYTVAGEVRLKAKSIAFANMKEAEFEQLYSKTIDVILKHILPNDWDEGRLRDAVENILRFT